MGSILDKVTYEQLLEAVNSSYNLTDAMIKIGYVKPRAKNYTSFKKLCDEWQIDFSHLSQNTINPLAHNHYKDEEVFCCKSKVSSSTLRKRYRQLDIEYKCVICGISNWQNKELTLHLEHINGNRTDNRLENLRWVCPNCDSQLDTYCGKNKEKTYNYCRDCGQVISFGAERCENCYRKASRKVERPTREKLKILIRTKSFTQIGKDFNVSDNTIRKWCDSYNLPRRKIDIKSYSKEEWDLI